MRILLINKYNYLRSGTERYMFNLKKLLVSEGHTVEIFAMHHPRNEPATYQAFFVPHIDFRALNFIQRLQVAMRVIWYPRAATLLGQVLDKFRPDVVHLNNIYHQLSPAILPPITARNIPVVQTLHDYKLICPNYLLYTQGQPCTRCKNGRYGQAVQHRCLHNSLAWSLLAAVEMRLHQSWQIYEHHVRTFITPSHFVKRMAESFGISARQLTHIPHFIYPDQITLLQETGNYFAYVGRLSAEKGLITLLQAMRQCPEAKLLLVGEGPERVILESMVAQWGLDNVTFGGYLTGTALQKALGRARFTVLPSEWYEVFGQAIVESFLGGRPVIGARIGAMPEVIDHEQNGLLFTPGDATELATCITTLWANPHQTQQMGLNGREKALTVYSPERYYATLMPLYTR